MDAKTEGEMKSDIRWLKWAVGGLYVVALSGVHLFDPTIFRWPPW